MAQDERRKIIDSVIQAKGEDWLIAALVDGSIGYYSPSTAKGTLEWYKEGHNNYGSERTSCVFKGDLLHELMFDIKCFERTETNNPRKVKTLIEFVQKAKNIEDFGFNAHFNAFYPTSI